MINNHKVSIIIPCYNAEEFVGETIESALNQTYKNIEIIIVDDHSSDNSIKIIKDYQLKSPQKIKVFINPGKGACAARNFGFEQSTGDYIQYLDADDLIPPDKIERQLLLTKSISDQPLISCAWSHFWQDISEAEYKPLSIYKDYEFPADLQIDMLVNREMLANHTWLVPRKTVIEAGQWNEDLLINQDGEFFSRVLLKSHNLKYCEGVMVYYRQTGDNSITRGKSTYDKKLSLLISLNLICDNLMKVDDSMRVKKAVSTLYSDFIISQAGYFEELVDMAKEKQKNIDLRPVYSNLPAQTRLLIRLVGFWKIVWLIGVYRQFRNNN